MKLKNPFKREPKPVMRTIPIQFPKPIGAIPDRQLFGLTMQFGSHFVQINSDNEELFKQVARMLDDQEVQWNEKVKFRIGEE